jgi:hypothetical protein
MCRPAIAAATDYAALVRRLFISPRRRDNAMPVRRLGWFPVAGGRALGH